MAKKKGKSKKKEEEEVEWDIESRFGLKEATVRGILAVTFLIVTVFLILSSVSMAGVTGEFTYKTFEKLFGVGYFILPLIFLMLSVVFLRGLEQKFSAIHWLGAGVFLISGVGLIGLFNESQGGLLGTLVAIPLEKLFDTYLSVIILIGLMLIAILIIFNASLPIGAWLERARERREEKRIREQEELELVQYQHEENRESSPEDKKETPESTPEEESTKKSWNIMPQIKKKVDELPINNGGGFHHNFQPPPLSYLKKDSGRPGTGDIKAQATTIKRTLQNFGINVEMDEISVGPTVTRYALKPAEGVKLSRIVGLHNDLSLALAAHPLRIEAPIPGKSLVGIEIPNTTKAMVGLGTLLASSSFQTSDKPLLIALGKSISGTAHFSNLAKMPHMLIAGATGAGKSVTLHSIITSLLYRNSPENMRFIMVDPKRVELTLYNSIPHLQTPVITDPKKAILGLKWAVKEMNRRYDILESFQVRDIDSYHQKIVKPEKDRLAKIKDDEVQSEVEPMPYIVIIIDELADIMASYPREMEAAVVRLAQMSRAVGIHLILSTQRPSVNVITGLIKANVPVRIALQVASQVDSRTILDASGAEKLLGAGDMLFMSGEMSKPQRLQSPFISEEEVKKVVKFLSQSWYGDPFDELDLTAEEKSGGLAGGPLGNSVDDDDDDDLYESAREVVIANQKGSASFLQRKLKVGYARASRLIDMLEERGVVGPGEGAKPRQVLEKPIENSENYGYDEDEDKF